MTFLALDYGANRLGLAISDDDARFALPLQTLSRRPNDTRGEVFSWIQENGAVYGWENPAWALRSGSGPFEPWHWEYTRGVQEDGEYYSS